VDRVWSTDNLTRKLMRELYKQHNEHICGSAEHWKQKRDARYGTLTWLRQVEPVSVGPTYRIQHMCAWYVLQEGAEPAATPVKRGPAPIDVVLTAGAIRQKQVRLGDVIGQFPKSVLGGATKKEAGRLMLLHLTSGPTIETDIVADKKMIRWRGWGPWLEACRVRDSDRIRFTPMDPDPRARQAVYRVSCLRSRRR
jgi:hypothetical protein